MQTQPPRSPIVFRVGRPVSLAKVERRKTIRQISLVRLIVIASVKDEAIPREQDLIGLMGAMISPF
ncbi:unnamed protein product [Clavelina lepadiformis]|uniref:Uncharacterized protein n=1 Tax=Clavelina lepadiformis TaxID=159417 RepID=A0ABP0H128_CLALP